MEYPIADDYADLSQDALESICIPRHQRIEDTYEPELEPPEDDLADFDFLG